MKLTKLLSVLLVLALLLCALPGAALAAETAVTDWASLAAALSAGGAVALASDIARPEGADPIVVPAGVTAALDLAGYTLAVGGVGPLADTCATDFGIQVCGALTLSDSAGTGMLTGSSAVAAIGGTFTLESGTIETDNDGVAVTPGAVFTMTGGVIEAPFPVADRDTDAEHFGTVDLRGGTVIGGYDFPDDPETGERGEIDGAVDLVHCKLYVSGDAEILATASAAVRLYGSTAEMSGGAVSGRFCMLVNEESAFTLSGGTLTGSGSGVEVIEGGSFTMTGGAVTAPVAVLGLGDEESGPCTLDVSGGTVTGGCPSSYYVLGAVSVYRCALTVSGDAEIVGTAGVGLSSITSETVMTGGTVTGDYDGIEAMYDGTFTMEGGAVRGGWAGLLLYEGTQGAVSGGSLSAAFEDALVVGAGCACAVSGGSFHDSEAGIRSFGDLSLSGAPEFSGIVNAELVLDDVTVRFDGPVTAAQPLRVRSSGDPSESTSVRLTENLPGNFDVSMLRSAYLGYRVGTDETGEAALYCDYGPASCADVAAEAWYADNVNFITHYGYMDGVGDGRFAPDAPADRLEAVAVLWRIAGCPASDAAIPFDDVSADSPYAPAVRWAAEAGIIEGVGDGFAPDGALTREAFATMGIRLLRYLGVIEWVPTRQYEDDFADAGAVSAWADAAMREMAFRSVIRGMDGRLNPQGVLTRAQTAAIAHRIVLWLPV